MEAGTHPLGLLVGEDARRPPGCEVAVDFEGVPGAALVRIHPVLTWIAGLGLGLGREAGRESCSLDSSRSSCHISAQQ